LTPERRFSKQTRAAFTSTSLAGLRQIVLAVTRSIRGLTIQARFRPLSRQRVRAFAAELGFCEIRAIPMSARFGDKCGRSVRRANSGMGRHKLSDLESVDWPDRCQFALPFGFLVQLGRATSIQSFAGFAGPRSLRNGFSLGRSVVVATSVRRAAQSIVGLLRVCWPRRGARPVDIGELGRPTWRLFRAASMLAAPNGPAAWSATISRRNVDLV